MRTLHRVLCAVACAASMQSLCTSSARAQRERSALDTTVLTDDAAAVVRTWQEYLWSKKGRYSQAAGTPSPYWIEAEQRRWPVYDLAGYYVLDEARTEIVSVEPVPAAVGDRRNTEYRITTRFRSGPPDAVTPTWWTAMTVTVFAVRENGTWKIANALPRTTATWRRDTVGPITYVYGSGYPYNRARAQRAVAFTDSLAAAFDVPRLAPLTYFLLPTVDEVYRIMGLESDVKFGPTGAVAQPTNHQLFSGIPSEGEAYRHELAHIMLAPLVKSGPALYFVSEGVPTWLGGTGGRSFRQATADLALYLRAHKSVTLDSLMAGGYPNPPFYAAGAVLTQLVYAHGGGARVKELFAAGRTVREFQQNVARMLGRSWASVATDWRRAVDSVGGLAIGPSGH